MEGRCEWHKASKWFHRIVVHLISCIPALTTHALLCLMNGVDMNGDHQASEHIGQLSPSVITTNNNSSLSVAVSTVLLKLLADPGCPVSSVPDISAAL